MPAASRSDALRVLAMDPFHGGSHRQFLRGVVNQSRHDWTLVVGKPVHWKWRMRSAPLELALTARAAIDEHGYPDVIFCTDMLDLPMWRGIVRDPRVLKTPTALYFHENQWTYPLAPEAREDSHFGYTNLLSALAADGCWFNSEYHRQDFLRASKSFVRRMPDGQQAHDFAGLDRKSRVIPPGFEEPDFDPQPATRVDGQGLTIGWVSRWEQDKRPDRLVDLVSKLDDRGDVDFRLVLLGPRPRQDSPPLQELRSRFAGRIVFDGYAETAEEYWDQLSRMDVVISTADHEFFGIAVCEAIWAGAAPVLPNRLSYPELVPSECLYDSLDEAVVMIEALQSKDLRGTRSHACRESIATLRAEQTVTKLDDALSELTT